LGNYNNFLKKSSLKIFLWFPNSWTKGRTVWYIFQSCQRPIEKLDGNTCRRTIRCQTHCWSRSTLNTWKSRKNLLRTERDNSSKQQRDSKTQTSITCLCPTLTVSLLSVLEFPKRLRSLPHRKEKLESDQMHLTSTFGTWTYSMMTHLYNFMQSSSKWWKTTNPYNLTNFLATSTNVLASRDALKTCVAFTKWILRGSKNLNLSETLTGTNCKF
jgi:hypothetical protein